MDTSRQRMFKNVCRVCSKYASGKKSLKIFEKVNSRIVDNIETITGLRLHRYDVLPELICECCNKELQDAIKFRTRCINAQQELLAMITDKQRERIAVKEQTEKLKAALSVVPLSELIDSEIDELDIKSGLEEEFLQEAQSPAEHMTDDVVSEEAEPIIYIEENEYQEIIEEDIEMNLNEMIKKEDELSLIKHDVEVTETYEYDSDDEVAVLDNVLDDEFENVKEKILNHPRKQKTIKTKIRRGGQSIFICEQCGNHVTGRVAFELHCRRHRGEKQFQCEICENRFCTTSELKRHMRKHTGERPFACKYCGRRFTDYTTNVKHERTHTNERPYVCTTCGKAFTTGYILKNHMLIHSGERAYRCELCDKNFMLSTHLITHNRSTVHKRNVEKQELMNAQAQALQDS